MVLLYNPTPVGKRWIAGFLLEDVVRTYLQTLYVGITGASENAQLLLDQDPINIKQSSASGNRLVKTCLASTVTWLELVREYCISPEIFTSQFLQPAKLAAAFRLSARHTIDLEGYVFSKSANFYDPYYKCKVFTLAVVVPLLQTAMSIRCRSEQWAETELGGINLKNVQPMPYVNRIHPFRLQIKKTETKPALSRWNFLKTSIQDASRFHNSIAFENFCEVLSTRFGRRFLGAPCILSGRLVWAKIPLLIIQSPVGNESINLLANEYLTSISNIDADRIKSLEGQMIRVLSVIWYGRFRRGIELLPEAFLLEKIENERDSLVDNLMGFVRLRGRVPLETIPKEFLCTDPSVLAPNIILREGYLEWQYELFHDSPIVQLFHEKNADIRRLRWQSGLAGAVVLTDRYSIINSEKLHEECLVAKLSRDIKLMNCFLSIIKYRDDFGYLPDKVKEMAKIVSRDNPDMFLRNILWLRWMRFLIRNRDGIIISNKALKIAYKLVRHTLISLLVQVQKEKSVIGLHEIENMTGFPPSLALKALREIEDEGWIHCLKKDNMKCDLVWILKKDIGKEELEQASNFLMLLEDQVLSVLKSVHFSLHCLKIIEMLQANGISLNYFTLILLLKTLENKGKISHKEDMWIYPWDRRIIDILNSKPYDLFTMDDIMSMASIPQFENEKFQVIVRGLEQRGDIWQPAPGRFCLAPCEDRDRNLVLLNMLKLKCEEHIMDTLKNKGGQVEEGWLMGETKLFIRKLADELRLTLNHYELSQKIIGNLLSQGILKRRDARDQTWLQLQMQSKK